MELNKSVLNAISEKLKVDSSKLIEVLGKNDASFEDLGSPVSVFFSKEEHETLVSNSQRNGYEQGVIAGQEMPLKKMRKSLTDSSNEFLSEALSDTKTIEDVLSKAEQIHANALSKAVEDTKKDFEGNQDDRVAELKGKLSNSESEYKKEKAALQKLIEERDIAHNNKIGELQNTISSERKSNLINKSLSDIDFSIPKDIKAKGENTIALYKNAQRDVIRTQIDQKYNIEFDDKKNAIFINKATGEKALTDTQEPQDVNAIRNSIIDTMFIKTSTRKASGREDHDSKIPMKNIKTEEDFSKEMNSIGVSFGTLEFDKKYSEWKKDNQN